MVTSGGRSGQRLCGSGVSQPVEHGMHHREKMGEAGILTIHCSVAQHRFSQSRKYSWEIAGKDIRHMIERFFSRINAERMPAKHVRKTHTVFPEIVIPFNAAADSVHCSFGKLVVGETLHRMNAARTAAALGKGGQERCTECP